MNAFFAHASGVRRQAAALILFAASLPCAAQTTYSIDVHTFGSGSNALANACFRLSGTIGDSAPGGSAEIVYAAYSGFWGATAPAVAADEVFFTGFEEC